MGNIYDDGVDRSKDIAIIVCSYNQTTRNISGQLVEDWLKKNKEKWCLDKLMLNGNLPLDIIEVVEIAKVFENKKKRCFTGNLGKSLLQSK